HAGHEPAAPVVAAGLGEGGEGAVAVQRVVQAGEDVGQRRDGHAVFERADAAERAGVGGEGGADDLHEADAGGAGPPVGVPLVADPRVAAGFLVHAPFD